MEPTNLTTSQFAAALRKINACSEAIEWAEGMDYDSAWNTCQNPQWLLFLLAAVQPLTAISNELLVCAFAREVLHLTVDPRVLACIETREAWANGTATSKERDAARAAAWGAAGAAAWGAAGAAARVAAGDAAGAAAWGASWDAARAAAWDASWDAAGAAAGAAARVAAGAASRDAAGDASWVAAEAAAGAKQCAIIRELIPQPAFDYAPALQS